MTNSTTGQTIEASTVTPTTTATDTVDLRAAVVTHLDDDLDLALELLLAGGITSSLICDGSCRGTASCCIAPVAPAAKLLAA